MKYQLDDGRYVLTEKNLHYALAPNTAVLKLDRIREEDMRNCNIITDPMLAEILDESLHEATWVSPQVAIKNARSEYQSFVRHYCILHNGSIYINNGGYKRLDDVINQSSPKAKAHIINQLAIQAALAQCDMAQLQYRKKHQVETAR